MKEMLLHLFGKFQHSHTYTSLALFHVTKFANHVLDELELKKFFNHFVFVLLEFMQR